MVRFFKQRHGLLTALAVVLVGLFVGSTVLAAGGRVLPATAKPGGSSLVEATDNGSMVSSGTRLYLPIVVAPGGRVLPATETVGGYSLEETALRTAAFNIVLDPNYYPEGLPFKILNTSADRTFVVEPGTYFYVPFAFVTPAPPVPGDYPEDASGGQSYFFGSDQLGGHDFVIEVDGLITPIGPEYLIGPLTTDPLPDGSNRYMVLAVFISPLGSGTHTVTLRGEFSGAAVLAMLGDVFAIDITYTVIVE